MEPNRLELSETIDNYDLTAAIENNPSDIIGCTGIVDKVFGEITGERDGHDWHWLVGFTDGRVGYITGGCDYTGWDCRSNITVKIFKDNEVIHVPLYDNTNQSPAKDFEAVISFLNQARGTHENCKTG